MTVVAGRRQALPADDRRKRLVRLIHVGKRELGLDDDGYRAALMRAAGKVSSSECSDAQLNRVFRELQRLGFKPRSSSAQRRRPAPADAKLRMIYAVWSDIRPMLDGDAGDAELRAFVRRQTRDGRHPDGIDAVEFLDDAQSNRVIAGLKAWRDRLESKQLHAEDVA